MRFNQEQFETLRQARARWGDEEQMQMAVGEIGELLTLFGRRVQGRDTDADWITEIADCMVMLEQLALMYGYSKVENMVGTKMERLRKRVQAATTMPPNCDFTVHKLPNGDFTVIK